MATSRHTRSKKVAVFDIDGTIFRSSLLIEVTEALVERGIFPKSVRGTYAKAYKKWLERRGGYAEYIGAVVRAFDKHIKGVKEKDFRAVTKNVIAFHQNRVYRYTRDLTRSLKKKGYYLLAISHSPKIIVQAFAYGLGFNKVYGRDKEVKNGSFTGKTLQEDFINDKAKVLTRAVATENLSLKDSIAVGDSEGDIPMMKKVDSPICFNPNKNLFQAAKRNGWKVVVERKDVIYTL